MFSVTKSLGHDHEGATAVEYAMMAAAIAAAVITIVLVLGLKVSGLFESVNSPWTAP